MIFVRIGLLSRVFRLYNILRVVWPPESTRFQLMEIRGQFFVEQHLRMQSERGKPPGYGVNIFSALNHTTRNTISLSHTAPDRSRPAMCPT